MLDTISILITILLVVPVSVFSIECLVGLAHISSKGDLIEGKDLKSIILVPAHNEESVISETLKNLKENSGRSDEILVVADNCNDSTSSIATEMGVSVVDRTHVTELGKGYALSFGIEQIAAKHDAPDIVVIMDADCYLEKSALQLLKGKANRSSRPVQACYLIRRGKISRLSIKIAEFTFLIKNKIRTRGLGRMGIPVPLTGSGMAFPWKLISEASLASGDIVEDMRLGLEMAEQGTGAIYCDDALVYSFFPSNPDAEKTQRERWEHGHLSNLKKFVPRLLISFLKNRNFRILGTILDLAVPPLSLLMLAIASSILVLSGIALYTQQWVFPGIALALFLIIAIITLLIWFLHGKSILSFRELVQMPLLLCSKIFIYLGFINKKQTKWIRTDRD